MKPIAEMSDQELLDYTLEHRSKCVADCQLIKDASALILRRMTAGREKKLVHENHYFPAPPSEGKD